MKRLGMILMACLLVLGLSQCKKDNTSENENKTIFISLNTSNELDGTKNDVTDEGVVSFGDGDVIYVVSNGRLYGLLTYSSGSFSGSIKTPVTDQPLYFYFLGNKRPYEGGLSTGAYGETKLTVDIYDQHRVVDMDDMYPYNQYPVISCGISEDSYGSPLAYTGQSSFRTTLRNKCAFVKIAYDDKSGKAFNASWKAWGLPVSACIVGVNNRVTVDFSKSTGDDDGFSYDKIGDGIIRANQSNRYVILLPQEDPVSALAYWSDWSFGTSPSQSFEIPALAENEIITSPINIRFDQNLGQMLPGRFGKDSDCHFSTGNAWWLGRPSYQIYVIPYMRDQFYSAGVGAEWKGHYNCVYRFDEYGNVIVGENYGNNTGGTLAGWGRATIDQSSPRPYLTSDDPDDYVTPTSWPTGTNNIGFVCKIPSDEEMNDILENCQAVFPAKINFVMTGFDPIETAENVKGTVILPEDFPDELSNIDIKDASYTWAQWAAMECRGAVFLPSCGYREGEKAGWDYGNQKDGYYWTYSWNGDEYVPRCFHFDEYGDCEVLKEYEWSRTNGCNYRLIWKPID